MEFKNVEISQTQASGVLMNQTPLGITCGDVGGIGLECFLKAWTTDTHPWAGRLYAQPEHLYAVAETLQGEPRALALALASKGKGQGLVLAPLDDISRETPTLGGWNPGWKEVSRASLEISIQEALAGNTCGVVTLPITKRIVVNDLERFPGQTELFASPDERPKMSSLSDALRMVAKLPPRSSQID